MQLPSIRRPGPYIPAGLAALLLWGFAAVADEVLEGDTTVFDSTVKGWFRAPGAPETPWGPVWLQEAVRDLTALGSFTVLGTVLVATVLYLAFSGKLRSALFVLISVIGGTILSTGLKAAFDRPRPDVEAAARVFTASFPSGHATVSAVVYLTLGLLMAEAVSHGRLKAYFIVLGILLTFAIGVSRIYLGVHFPTDVLAGWALGGAWALVCWIVYSLSLGKDASAGDTAERRS